MQARIIVVVVAAVLLSAGAAVAQPAQSPAPMYGLNTSNTNVSSYVGVSSNPRILWQVSHAQPSIDSPALVLDNRGILYSADHAPVWAATGQDVSFLNMSFWRDGAPVIDTQGNIYHWESGRFHAYRSDGTALWTAGQTGCSDGITPTMGSDGTIFAQDCGGTLHAYTPSGTEKWASPWGGDLAPATSDARGNTYVSTGYVSGQYVSFDPNGNIRWTSPWSKTWCGGPMRLGPDGNLYSSEYYGTVVYVRDPTTGNILRQQPNLYGGIQAIGADGTLYSASYQTVQATDLYGAIKWKATVPSNIYLQDLVVDSAGKVFCMTEENQLFAFSNTGAQLWSLQLPKSNWQTLPPIIGTDGTIYLLNGGDLMAIVPEPASLSLLALGGVALLRRRK